MAETPVQNDVFKFMALRPPAKRKTQPSKLERIEDLRRPGETPVGKIIREMGDNADMGSVLPQVKIFIDQKNWVPDIHEDQALAVITDVRRAIDEQLRDFSSEGFLDSLKMILGMTPEDFVQSEQANQIRHDLWDRLQAFYLLNRDTPVDLEEITDGLRALHVIELLASGEKFNAVASLQKAFSTAVLLSEAFVRIAPMKPAERPRVREQQERDKFERERFTSLWAKYIELNKAVEEIQQLEPIIEEEYSKPEPIHEKLNQVERSSSPEKEMQAEQQLFTTSFRRSVTFAKPDIDKLSDATSKVLTQVSKEPGRFAKSEALNRVHKELAFISDQLFAINDSRLAEVMPAEAKQLPAAMSIMGKNLYSSPLKFNALLSGFPFPWSKRPKIRPLGIGDLKVVKQTLEKYVAGEVAHIENVLQGESKERKHRRFDRTEDTVTIALETTKETERDMQTTDRFELKKETEKTIQTDRSEKAGITVSASYGPVELGASANFAYSQSTTDTTRTASNFARDVVDRSVTRIQNKTREERITRTIHEVEEINTHGLDNVGGEGHITGVYRWVDKHYKAQIFNYGKRMMFEFIVPEPAAFFIHSQNNNPTTTINVEKPIPLGNITHRDITEWNYQNYIRDYHVQGVTPPPPFSHVLVATLDQSGVPMDGTSSKSSRDLVVPDGYTARNWSGRYYWQEWNAHHNFDVIVGITGGISTVGTSGGSSAGGRSTIGTAYGNGRMANEDMVVPIAIKTFNINAYAVVIEVECERTARHYEDWQIKTFEKIMAAYQAAMAQYENKLRATEASSGVLIAGQNPRINREIERTEMKKHCITMLTGEHYQNFNSMSGNPPEIDLVDAAIEGKFIQFFEQAFEWEQMTYLFYPYFWGRKENWVKVSTTFDNDPLFTRFLQAGSARVVIPVHPAYNDAILYYSQTDLLWNGGDAPIIRDDDDPDPLYIALYEELKAQQDDLDNAKPEGNPWKVVLPTTLVWLQPEPALPDFTQP